MVEMADVLMATSLDELRATLASGCHMQSRDMLRQQAAYARLYSVKCAYRRAVFGAVSSSQRKFLCEEGCMLSDHATVATARAYE